MKNKLIVLGLLLVGVLIANSKTSRASEYDSSLIGGGDAAFFTTVIISSGQVHTGSGKVLRVVLATGTVTGSAGADWAVVFDTVAASFATLANFDRTQLIAPATLFNTTNTVNNASVPNNYMPIPDFGVRVQNGIFVLKSTTGTGFAHTVTVYWRR